MQPLNIVGCKTDAQVAIDTHFSYCFPKFNQNGLIGKGFFNPLTAN